MGLFLSLCYASRRNTVLLAITQHPPLGSKSHVFPSHGNAGGPNPHISRLRHQCLPHNEADSISVKNPDSHAPYVVRYFYASLPLESPFAPLSSSSTKANSNPFFPPSPFLYRRRLRQPLTIKG